MPFEERFKNWDPLAIDLLKKMLYFDPKNRVNAAEALKHPYLEPYHDPTDEPEAEYTFNWSEFDDNKVSELPVENWRERIDTEILKINKR